MLRDCAACGAPEDEDAIGYIIVGKESLPLCRKCDFYRLAPDYDDLQGPQRHALHQRRAAVLAAQIRHRRGEMTVADLIALLGEYGKQDQRVYFTQHPQMTQRYTNQCSFVTGSGVVNDAMGAGDDLILFIV